MALSPKEVFDIDSKRFQNMLLSHEAVIDNALLSHWNGKEYKHYMNQQNRQLIDALKAKYIKKGWTVQILNDMNDSTITILVFGQS